MAATAETASMNSLELGRILQGDCIELLQEVPSGSVDLVFADPPFNIGYQYDQYHDQQDADDYVAWSRAWMDQVHRVLKPNGTFWLAIGDEFAAELKFVAQHQIGFIARSWVVWYYTFGVNCRRKFSRSHAHLLHFTKDESDFTFNAEDPQVRVPSARALVYADKRASPAGRLPDDTWILRPQDLPEGFQPTDDTWYFARVAGTFKERQGFHGCQMPEQLLGRIIRASSNPDDIVLDPFAGSGTTLAAAKKLGREWIGCELSADYVAAATQRLEGIASGDALDGPADPIASAPATAKGRRLSDVTNADTSAERSDESTAESAAAEPVAIESATASAKTATPEQETAAVTTVSLKRELRVLVKAAIVDAFFAAHDGYSIDWMLASPKLQSAFYEACRESGLIGGPADWNRELLKIRKTGEFPRRGDIRSVHFTVEEMDEYEFGAEMAWRWTTDKFGGPSLDEVFCDPDKAAYFDRMAKRFAPGFDPASIRWAALRLRKSSRDLVRDMKQYHFVFAKRDFGRYQPWHRFHPSRFDGVPGLYMLRGEGKTPLFIGRTLDLGRRLARHDECPAISDLVEHVAILAGEELPAEVYLPAFQEDLVRRHRPLWNMDLVGLYSATLD